MRLLSSFFIWAVIHITISAQYIGTDTIWYNGPSDNRINIVVLSDGYQSNEMDKYEEDVLRFSEKLKKESPYKSYFNYFNFFALKVASNESGADHPGTATDVSEPVHPVADVDNYFGSTFDYAGIHRLLVATNGIAITTVLATHFPSYDQVFILVNSPYYGGSGGSRAVASTHTQSAEVAIHEIGHSFAGLADEYYAGDVYAREASNMTKQTDSSLVRWTNWMGYEGIGIYQHCCGGNSALWYRPHQSCKMRSLGNPFCAVCRQATVERIHSLVRPYDEFAPAETNLEAVSFPLAFRLATVTPEPNTLQVRWFVNDILQSTEDPEFVMIEEQAVPGINTIEAYLLDTTDFLRIDGHHEIHLHRIRWEFETDTMTTGIRPSSDQIDLSVFPNPASDQVFIAINDATTGPVDIRLIDMSGRIVQPRFSENGIHYTVETRSMPGGFYTLEITKNRQIIARQKLLIR